MKKIEIYDTTLRDGAQGEGISFSGVGKIRVARILDELGVDYIEGGYAASNPKDMEFFHAIRKEPLKHARIAAFGSTRRSNINVAEDANTRALLDADTPVVTIFGKSWAFHVREVLRTTEEENRAMIYDTVRFLKENGREVIYDAEHFFDGYKDSPAHAMATLKAAKDAGADRLVLCDTNGGTLYYDVGEMTREVIRQFGPQVGIHTHNDSELGVANSLEAIRAGAMHVQGTINGFGERCGNANLCSIIPNLALKMGYTVLQAPENLKQLKSVSDFVHEMANVRPNDKAAFVGQSAFAHKAGMHVDGVNKNPHSFEHIEPESVGNKRRVLISELSGAKIIFNHFDPTLTFEALLTDGSRIKKGDIGFTITGTARSILTCERLVLNCMQRMSGIATYTHHLNSLISDTSAKLLDTRKTTPNFRLLEKWAVVIGGGKNHRIGLYDMIMLKDNHIDIAGGISTAIFQTKEYLREKNKALKIEIEVRNLNELREVLEVGGVDNILLDNMDVPTLKEAVSLVDKRFVTEASGGITESTITEIAKTGVDYISVGALTHSYKSLDLSLKEY